MIKVRNVGILSFPIYKEQVNNLISISSASISKVNPKGNNLIKKEVISISGIGFNKFFEGIIGTIRESMGLSGESVEAKLYLLLIFKDEDTSFLPRSDIAKKFGTLVLTLPCPHAGGDLMIQHDGKETIVSMENNSVSEIKWCAFYDDSKHEVTPVTSGYHVCLVYNLLRSGSKKINLNYSSEALIRSIWMTFGRKLPASMIFDNKKTGKARSKHKPNTLPPLMFKTRAMIRKESEAKEAAKMSTSKSKNPRTKGKAEVQKITKKAKTSTTSTAPISVDDDEEEEEEEEEDDDDEDYDEYEGPVPKQIIYVLKNEYNDGTITLESLNGGDAIIARTLINLANEAGISLYLGYLHITSVGDYSGPHYEYDEEYNETEVEYKLEELRDIQTGKRLTKNIRVKPDEEVMPADALNDFEPYEKDIDDDGTGLTEHQ
ncbi:hypothetical protein SAMD00019534_086110 [Acytostelium subglobosum LB1]|uniref:hypothetical protein n=1 Tax=Acytostelium subglobosum LB1 TaxID=1410327 RepID=UPI000644FBF3|nr:hypothetical protein SAMD00019534_086110 [Acytostelium subglobosum LB1]GAM25436.1 hypothetical protein SAMD00019534_086110 [Acytostelium subglobosum LB1]|eukprot:XP_012751422.1 hypothetical protein SAMD00019534_086110 [Acytostelium subglobosum LB1]